MPPGRRPQQLPSNLEDAAVDEPSPVEQLVGLWAPPLPLSDLDAAPVTVAARIRLPA